MVKESKVETFSDLYCERRGISPDDFESCLLLESLHPSVRWLGRLVLRFSLQSFPDELDYLSSLGGALDRSGYRAQVEEIASYNRVNLPFVRRILLLRISSKRLIRLSAEFRLPKSKQPQRSEISKMLRDDNDQKSKSLLDLDKIVEESRSAPKTDSEVRPTLPPPKNKVLIENQDEVVVLRRKKKSPMSAERLRRKMNEKR